MRRLNLDFCCSTPETNHYSKSSASFIFKIWVLSANIVSGCHCLLVLSKDKPRKYVYFFFHKHIFTKRHPFTSIFLYLLKSKRSCQCFEFEPNITVSICPHYFHIGKSLTVWSQCPLSLV